MLLLRWMDGRVGRGKNHFKDCLQQLKIQFFYIHLHKKIKYQDSKPCVSPLSFHNQFRVLVNFGKYVFVNFTIQMMTLLQLEFFSVYVMVFDLRIKKTAHKLAISLVRFNKTFCCAFILLSKHLNLFYGCPKLCRFYNKSVSYLNWIVF